jgi:adenine-specific DNA methylase
VGYSFKRTHRVYANDCEAYAFEISKALLADYTKYSCQTIMDQVMVAFETNMGRISEPYRNLLMQEPSVLNRAVPLEVEEFYKAIPTVWNGKANMIFEAYELFLCYYSASYFGLQQTAEIDSLRYAIEPFKNTELFPPLITSLYFAMKECVFAKDGHMAQPLNIEKNFSKLLKQRSKSILHFFRLKIAEFFSTDFVVPTFANKAFHMDFENLLRLPEIQQDVDLIYADPPYTDMQYSRYYHLLNFVTQYEPLRPTIVNGTYTKGLYTEGRYQSKLSVKSKCLNTFETLIDFSHTFHKNLMISFAYPVNIKAQKTDRYVMSIDSLIYACSSQFGSKNVEIHSCDYTHSNNRNSEHKKVHEYLIVCNSKQGKG